VKLWRCGESDALGSIWRASAFSDTGEVDDDSNATRIHHPRDVGRTLFADEASAWAAYLGEAPTPQGVAAELEERADALEACARAPLAPLTIGSIWWSIRPCLESCEDGPVSPAPVKLWRCGESDALGSIWRASAFSDTGEVDDDSNATRIHHPRDVGRTLFADEASAWAAYLGEAPTPQSIAVELEERAAALEADSAKRSPLAAAHAAALREIAGLLVRHAVPGRVCRRVTNPKEVLDLWRQGLTGTRPALDIAPSALRLLRQAGCVTGEGDYVTPRGAEVQQALDLYEACLWVMGADDTAETDDGVKAAQRRGLIRINPDTDGYELSPEGEALVKAVGVAKARVAQEGPVVWPGAAVDVVLRWPARPAPGLGDGLDITIPGGAATKEK
jgi:hypothetical protein